MRAPLILAFVLLAAPAHAHCYSHWAYPYPQRCTHGVDKAAKVAKVAKVDPAKMKLEPMRTKIERPVAPPPAVIPDIPVGPLPPLREEEEHALALTALRNNLAGLH